MPTTQSTPKLSDKDFEALAKIIYDRSGIRFQINRRYVLESRLGHRLRELELDGFDQYVALLSMGPYQNDEFQEMFNRITINETSFFRHDAQLEVFERAVLSEVLEARKASKRLRIWSAACSSGEEPFTLAIMVHRTLGVRLADWHVEILGTDISERCLDIASSGTYGDYAMRTTPDMIKRRYFTQKGSQWSLSNEIRDLVNFELHNLKDRVGAKRHGTWDIIFCRNAMIYFDDDMKRQVLRTFHDQLANDGTLFIGHSETIRPDDAPFVARSERSGFCYRKA
ncbi:MAG: protein-glutamate O-methyltransferase CheR [Phycisphaeraceae bacterium]|nr:protein-glutamate O-methyltransferase CheR [Phycisphaeraceae bacterium]